MLTEMTTVQFFVIVFWLWAMKLTAASTDDLEQVLGAAVLEALTRAHLTTKEAAGLMRIDESQLRHGLRGERGYHISLTRLCRLPFPFWCWFSPALAYLVAKRNITAIADDLGITKASR